MKKPNKHGQMRPEYTFRNGRRGRYAERYAEGTNIVRLDADVAALFSSSESVNDALREVANSRIDLDRRHREIDGQMRRKRGDTLIGTLRDCYGPGFLPGFRSDMRLDAVLEQTKSHSLSELLAKAKRAPK